MNFVSVRWLNIVFAVASGLSWAPSVSAQGLPTGIYRGTRVCSDGSVPTDQLSIYPVFFDLKPDGTFTSLTNIYKKGDSVCSELITGTYRFSKNTLITTSDTFQRCGDCEDNGSSQPGHQETKSDIEPTANGFILRLFTDYQEGGSCKPGQHMVVTFKKMNDSNEDLGLVCKPVEAF